MPRKKEKIPPITPRDPRLPLDETLPRGEMHFPPSRMDPDGGWTGNPQSVKNPGREKGEK